MKSLLPLLFVAFGLVSLTSGQEIKSLLDVCASPPPPTKFLSEKIALPTIYKVSGSVTDFKKPTSSYLVETSTNDYRVLERHSRDQLPERWIKELTGEKVNMFVNVTSKTCEGGAPSPQLFAISRFTEVIGNDTSSLASIVNGLVKFSKEHSGFLIDDSEVVGGMSTTKWISCLNGTNANDTKVVVEVRYTSENGIRPAQTAFSNPLVLSIRLVEIPTFNSTGAALSDVSVELDKYELPENDEAKIEHGIYCTNRNGTGLPLKQLDEFAAFLNYYDYSTNTSETVEIFYSQSRQIFIVGGHEMQHGVRILKAGPSRFRNGTDFIIHDFKYGYEFTMRHAACDTFGALLDSTNDVLKDNNNTLHMKPLEVMLADPVLQFNKYQSDTDMAGVPHQTYRAYDLRDDTVVEAHLTDDGDLLSISTYRMGSRHLAVTLNISPMQVESSRLNYKIAQLSDCYDGGKYTNNTWVIDIMNKNVTDMTSVGLNALNEAVAESVAKNVYQIIPYRVLVFWVEKADNGVAMIFRISEKTDKEPAQVVGYNFTAELSAQELFAKMNETLFLEKMPIEVNKSDGTKEEWMLNGKTMKLYPNTNDNGFLGYTGGAMFVLAIFCLLIGVSIGAVGVFVATRRQRISTLAYQVFE